MILGRVRELWRPSNGLGGVLGVGLDFLAGILYACHHGRPWDLVSCHINPETAPLPAMPASLVLFDFSGPPLRALEGSWLCSFECLSAI